MYFFIEKQCLIKELTVIPPTDEAVGFLVVISMKNILKLILGFFEYASLFLVGYYGIKYAIIAGPIFFGNPIGTLIGGIVALLFVFHLLRKEGLIEL